MNWDELLLHCITLHCIWIALHWIKSSITLHWIHPIALSWVHYISNLFSQNFVSVKIKMFNFFGWTVQVGCGCWMWMLDVGCWMLDVGCWMWMLDVGCWMLDVDVGLLGASQLNTTNFLVVLLFLSFQVHQTTTGCINELSNRHFLLTWLFFINFIVIELSMVFFLWNEIFFFFEKLDFFEKCNIQ